MPLGRLELVLDRVALRVRAQRALRGASIYGVAGAALGTLTAATMALDALGTSDATLALGLSLALPVVGALLGAARPFTRLDQALLVDRSHRLSGRIACAVELETQESPMAKAAVRDAIARSSELSPKRAMPIHAPRALVPALALGALALSLTFVERPRADVPAPVVHPRTLSALVLHEDDIAAHREALARLTERPERSPAVTREVERVSALLEDLSDRRVEREAVLRELGDIARGLRDARPGAVSGIQDTLERLERPLARSPRAEALSRALGERDLSAAAAEMDALRERLTSEPPSAAELRALREALASAAADLDTAAIERERAELEEREESLLRRREEERAAGETEMARREEERDRELERLRRDIEERRDASEALERLRRAMQDAARESGESGESGESEESGALERAAEDLHRFAEDQMTSEELSALERQIEALRELIRRSRDEGSGDEEDGGEGDGDDSEGHGESASERMREFVMRARGESEGDDGDGVALATPGGSGGGGEGEAEGATGEGGEGEGEASAAGAGSGEGEGESGGEGGEMLALGEGEDRLVLPGAGEPGPGGSEGDEGPGAGGGEESGEEGDGSGGAHDSSRLADAAERSGEHTTVRVTGEPGRGPTRSEVIRSSAARGFATSEYRSVYSDYLDHAEEVIEDEAIPPGYRFYVRRYFQLIRPRDAE